jgi:hypothetical protein
MENEFRIIEKYAEEKDLENNMFLHQPYSYYTSNKNSTFHYLKSNSKVELFNIKKPITFYKEENSFLSIDGKEIDGSGWFVGRTGDVWVSSVYDIKDLLNELNISIDAVRSDPEYLGKIIINKAKQSKQTSKINNDYENYRLTLESRGFRLDFINNEYTSNHFATIETFRKIEYDIEEIIKVKNFGDGNYLIIEHTQHIKDNYVHYNY